MNLRRRLQRMVPDDGAAIVLVALSLTVLLFFAAVAIDAAGFGFNERRQAQSAADVGALTAVQMAVTGNLGNTECSGYTGLQRARCNGAAEAMETANASLIDASLADWTDASRCGSPPAGYTVSPITSCVAFTSNNQRAWVRIPTIPRPTTLARAVGIDTVNVSADAIAGASGGAAGTVLPFLLTQNSANADYGCLKKNGGQVSWGPCADVPVTGNFGDMNFYRYGNLDFGHLRACFSDPTNPNHMLIANMALGVDHPLGKHPTGISGFAGVDRHDRDGCPQFNYQPNMANSSTGVGNSLEDGMLFGGTHYATSPYPGRIQDAGGYKVRNAQGQTPETRIDHTPIWDFLLSGLPAPCNSVSTGAQMTACIAYAKANSLVIFDDAIATSRRFAFTPEMWEPNPLPGNSTYHIKQFRPVYLDTTAYGCNNNGCSIIHTPGVANSGSCPTPQPHITCGTPGQGNKSIDAMLIYILSTDILPPGAQNPSPGAENQLRYNLID